MRKNLLVCDSESREVKVNSAFEHIKDVSHLFLLVRTEFEPAIGDHNPRKLIKRTTADHDNPLG